MSEPRKPIAIAMAREGSDDSDRYSFIVALCNDGTVWYTDSYHLNGWSRMADIPQEEPA